jgi:hypothetical protein
MAEKRYTEIEGNTKFTGDTVTIGGTLAVTGGQTLVLTSGPTGTTVGAAWTSGAPLLTAAQQCITIKAGSTNYKIPVWTV